ncbi:cell division protein SepF [Streptococcus caviae]|uniref:cell division protein SepF n=1 Tax=Streptococcus sp. 'caviae' TaxID=1915004 RepID=UPI00094B9C4D|nr:cell division protein SepF [Streptococcus sp. 'caviae']OLN84048.1 cell division protein SepF [Streptococcus sp. 'caviae']
MALRDSFNRIISYFDTDEVSEVEEPVAVPARQQESAKRPAAQQTQQNAKKSHQPNQGASRPSQGQSGQNRRPASEENIHPLPTRRNNAQQSAQEKTTIALKFPRKYEDAEEIVDLLIRNECVLIDFQYMLEAQARRCLDFIDGASKVLAGNLQKVGASMYLLTPINVIVDIEEMSLAANGQDVSFNYDMKRR